MVWLISSCTDRISKIIFLIDYINLLPAMAWCILKVHKRKLLCLLFHLLSVWQHPNEPRGLNQSKFELNIEKKHDRNIFDN